jgi:hypothetical protein
MTRVHEKSTAQSFGAGNPGARPPEAGAAPSGGSGDASAQSVGAIY